MSVGERGPKGDHGQEGDLGQTGMQGPKGDKGEPGESIGMLGFLSRHAIAITYVAILALSMLGFTQATNARHNLRVEAHRAEMRACVLDQHSWTQRHAIIETFTEPATVSPQVLALPKAQSDPLIFQVKTANERRVRQRARLVKIDGSKPKC